MWCEALHVREIMGLKNDSLISSLWHFSALVNSENGEWQENGERWNYMQKRLNADVGCNWYYLSPVSHGSISTSVSFSIKSWGNIFWWRLISVSRSCLLAQHIIWNIRLIWLRQSHTQWQSWARQNVQDALPTKLLKSRILDISCNWSLP